MKDGEVLETGKWRTDKWQGPMILVEYWNGNIGRLPYKNVNWQEVGQENGIVRWMVIPD